VLGGDLDLGLQIISFLICDFATEMGANQMPDSAASMVDGRTMWAFNPDPDRRACEAVLRQRIISQSVEELCSASVAARAFSPIEFDVNDFLRLFFIRLPNEGNCLLHPANEQAALDDEPLLHARRAITHNPVLISASLAALCSYLRLSLRNSNTLGQESD
jgi:hypothetical protein